MIDISKLVPIEEEKKYTSIRIVDGKPRKVIVDENGKIINRNPDKDEFKGIEDEKYKIKRKNQSYTDEQLLDELRNFTIENGRIPSGRDFDINKNYPSKTVYSNWFGSWNKALEKAGLNINMKMTDSSITDHELIKKLIQFYNEDGKAPARRDFVKNPKYPSFKMYQKRFGSWMKALKIAKLDPDSLIEKGLVNSESNASLKGRLFEILILKSFKTNGAIDLSGEKCTNNFDGICPKGKTYDAKSSCLHKGLYWFFGITNKFIENIDYLFLGAFDENFGKLLHVWMVPKKYFNDKGISITVYIEDIDEMKQYEITNKCVDIVDILGAKI